MEDIIDIIVTETTNTIEITAQPNDEIIDVNIIDNREDIVLNVTPTVVEININSLTSNFGVEWGDITGTLANQTDLNNALALKANLVGGKVPASELPSYVDDVVEVSTFSALPATGEIGKIYVILDTNKIYRWSGSVYVEIADSTAVWGAITGTLSNQTDLQNALNAKQDDLNGTGFVKASGTTISYDNSTYALDSAVVKLAGAQTITGLKTFSGGLIANVSTGGDQGFYSINTSTSASSVFVQNNSTGIGILANNALGGDAILIGNDTSGRGIYITNATISGSGKGISIDNYNSGIGIEVGSDSSADAIKVLHLAGRAFNIQSSGGGYGVIINNTTASTSAPFTIQKQGASVITLTDAGAGTFNSSLTANSFVKTSGTSSQFLKADGSVHSSTYALDSAVVKLTGNQTVAGIKTMSNVFKLDDTLQIKNIAQLSNNTGYTGVWAETAAIGFYTGANAIRLLYAGNYNYTMPSADGTLALTSQLSSYLPLSGGTLTGALSGTSATFSGQVTSTTNFYTASISDTLGARAFGGNSFSIRNNIAEDFNIDIYNRTSSVWYNALKLANNGGAATFSSNIHIPSASSPGQGYFYFDYLSTQADSRTWRIANDYNVYGDFQIQQSTTQSGSTYSKILGFSPTGAATFSSSVTATSVRLSDGNEIGWGANTTFLLGDSANNNFRFFTNNTEKVRITSAGNVGIGTTAPTAISGFTSLTLNNATNGGIIDFQTNGTGVGRIINDSSTFNLLSLGASSVLILGTNGSEKMRITSGGKLLVNRTATIFANSGHSIQGDVSSGGEPVLEVYNQSLSDSSPALACFKNSGTTSSSARFMQFYSDAGTIAMGGIVGNGTSNVQFASISDIRKKENVNKLNNSLNKIMALNPVSFNWKSNNEFVSAGFIAQEVENVFPEYVVENMLEENGITYKGLTGGMTGGIVPVLVKAIQELKAELDTLKNK